jgi:hypothetical protein
MSLFVNAQTVDTKVSEERVRLKVAYPNADLNGDINLFEIDKNALIARVAPGQSGKVKILQYEVYYVIGESGAPCIIVNVVYVHTICFGLFSCGGHIYSGAVCN